MLVKLFRSNVRKFGCSLELSLSQPMASSSQGRPSKTVVGRGVSRIMG